MAVPPFLVGLLQLLFDLAVPVAMCTMVMAGVALRQESGMNFEVGGRFQRWMLWTAILLMANDPGRYWMLILALVNRFGNVMLPLHGAIQVRLSCRRPLFNDDWSDLGEEYSRGAGLFRIVGNIEPGGNQDSRRTQDPTPFM